LRVTPLPTLLFFALLATLLSIVPTITYHPPSLYFPGSIEAGFPYQSYIRLISSQRTAHCGPSGHCTLVQYYNPNIPARISYFLADTAIYAALVVGIITAYNATRHLSRKLKAMTSTPPAI